MLYLVSLQLNKKIFMAKFQRENSGLFTLVTVKKHTCAGCGETIEKGSLALRFWERMPERFLEEYYCKNCYKIVDSPEEKAEAPRKTFIFPVMV